MTLVEESWNGHGNFCGKSKIDGDPTEIHFINKKMTPRELALCRYQAIDNSFLLWIALCIIICRMVYLATDLTTITTSHS